MTRRSHVLSAMECLLLFGLALGLAGSAFSQQPAQQRGQGQAQRPAAGAQPGPGKGAHPPLFFSEVWNHPQKEQVPLTQEHVSNPNLELKFYGGAKGGMEITGANDGGEDNPVRIFMGTCVTQCGAMFRDKNNYVDLSGLARIKWLVRVSGFHKLRPMVKLADGTYLVGDRADGEVSDYYEIEFAIGDVHWLKVDPDKLLTHGEILDKVDLSKVDEVGFVDLMPGSGHGQGGFSSMSRFAVYGRPVPREPVQSRAN
jgi:hypothetical protein